MSGSIQAIGIIGNRGGCLVDRMVGQMISLVIGVGVRYTIRIRRLSQVSYGIVGISCLSRIGFGNGRETVQRVIRVSCLNTAAERDQIVGNVVSIRQRAIRFGGGYQTVIVVILVG